ncbi:MAG: bifunctional diguanylate cyclase/phosphodiesterase [Acidobacteriaceae bacterium]
MDPIRETFYQTLLEASAIFSSGTDTPLHEVFQKLADRTAERLGFPCVWIGWLPPEEEWVQVLAASGTAAAYAQDLRVSADPDVPEGQGPAGVALRSGEIGYLNDFSAPNFSPWQDHARTFGLCGIAQVPFSGPSGERGILAMYQNVQDHFPDDLHPLLERLQLDLGQFLQRREGARELVRLQQYQTAAIEAQQALLQLQDPVEMLHRLTEIIVDKTDAVAAHVIMHQTETDELKIIAASARDDSVRQALLRLRFPMHPPDFSPEDTVASRSFRERSPVGPTSTETPWLRTFLEQEPALRAIRALMGWPILLEGEEEPYAVLVIDVAAHQHFTGAMQQLLRQLADSFSVAMERKRNEESLRKLSLAVEQNPSSIVITDLDANIEYVNGAFVRASGYDRSEVLGQNPRILQSGRTPKDTYTDMWSTLAREETWKGEFINRAKDGREYIELAQVSPVRQADGSITHYLSIKEDITERKRNEDALRASEQKFLRLFIDAPIPLAFINKDGVIVNVNRSFTEMFGYTHDEVPTMGAWGKRAYPDPIYRRQLRDRWKDNVARSEKTGTDVAPTEHFVTCKDGSVRTVLIGGIAIQDNFLSTFIDITERKQNEEALRESEERWKFALEGSEAGVFDWDLLGDTISYSEQWEKILGFSRDEFGHHSHDAFARVHPEDLPLLMGDIHACLQGSAASFSTEVRMQCKDGHWKWAQARGMVVRRDADNKALRLIGTISDISLRKATEEEVRHLAFHDSLTGLPNRMSLEGHLEKAMARALRHKKQLAVCMLDLDDFKPVNDTYGHSVGDQLLRVLAVRLQTFMRASDFIARLGGDEFVLLVEDLKDQYDLAQVMSNIQQAVEMPFVLSSQVTVEVKTSIGVCLYDPSRSEEEDTGDFLLRRADLALYQSKEHKTDREHAWFIYEGEKTLPTRARQLLSTGGLRIFYQPVLDGHSRRAVGAEALARLQDVDGSIQSPAEFLPQLNSKDLFALWDLVLTQVFTDMDRLEKQGLPLRNVSINVAPSTFCNGCVDALRKALAPGRIAPSRITLEILESSEFLAPAPETLRVMQEIKALGVHLALDDVGSAYSSLLRIRDLPIDAIKLAKDIVRALPDRPQDLHFVLALRDLAQGLGIRLVVEGVETDEILDAMMTLGVPLMQGHAIAAPMPIAALEEWLRHAPDWQKDQHPNSPLGIYAYQMAQWNTLQTTLSFSPGLAPKLGLDDPESCPVQRYLRRMGFGEGSEVDRLHREYHQAFANFDAELAASPHSEDWQGIIQAHEALLQSLMDAWKVVGGPVPNPADLHIVKQ